MIYVRFVVGFTPARSGHLYTENIRKPRKFPETKPLHSSPEHLILPFYIKYMAFLSYKSISW